MIWRRIHSCSTLGPQHTRSANTSDQASYFGPRMRRRPRFSSLRPAEPHSCYHNSRTPASAPQRNSPPRLPAVKFFKSQRRPGTQALSTARRVWACCMYTMQAATSQRQRAYISGRAKRKPHRRTRQQQAWRCGCMSHLQRNELCLLALRQLQDAVHARPCLRVLLQLAQHALRRNPLPRARSLA